VSRGLLKGQHSCRRGCGRVPRLLRRDAPPAPVDRTVLCPAPHACTMCPAPRTLCEGSILRERVTGRTPGSPRTGGRQKCLCAGTPAPLHVLARRHPTPVHPTPPLPHAAAPPHPPHPTPPHPTHPTPPHPCRTQDFDELARIAETHGDGTVSEEGGSCVWVCVCMGGGAGHSAFSPPPPPHLRPIFVTSTRGGAPTERLPTHPRGPARPRPPPPSQTSSSRVPVPTDMDTHRSVGTQHVTSLLHIPLPPLPTFFSFSP
jgi:hypothetical protein